MNRLKTNTAVGKKSLLKTKISRPRLKKIRLKLQETFVKRISLRHIAILWFHMTLRKGARQINWFPMNYQKKQTSTCHNNKSFLDCIVISEEHQLNGQRELNPKTYTKATTSSTQDFANRVNTGLSSQDILPKYAIDV